MPDLFPVPVAAPMSVPASGSAQKSPLPESGLPLVPAARAQKESPKRPPPFVRPSGYPKEADFRRFTDYLFLLLGAGTGLVLHEGGHVLMDYAVGAEPTFVPVKLGPFPFFAIQPSHLETNQQRYTVAMTGFMMQDIYSELILHIDPRLREHHHPFLKGMLAFHVLLNTGYAITGFANIGPAQSDVNTMARSLGVPPWSIGLMLIAPALVDTYRYFVPDSRWAPWVSMGSKLTMIGGALAF